jgi:putative aldouronate transport system permease protein
MDNIADSKDASGSNRGVKKKKAVSYALKKDWQKYLMLAIPLIVVFVFNYIPMYGIVMPFQKYNIIKGVFGSTWIGFANFITTFTMPRFGRVLRNTLLINILSLIMGFPAPVILAVFISEMKNTLIVKTVQTVSYLPHFLSSVIIAGLVSQLCAPHTGLFNQFVAVTGGSDLPFLTQPVWWLFTYIVSGIWEGIGWGSIIYIAAITAVNPELYEAAIVDGATRMQKIWHVTLPSIRPMIVLMLILSMGGIVSIGFERPWAFSNAMVTDISEVISIFVYNVGLGQGNFDIGATVGLFQSTVGVALVLIVNAIAKVMGEQGL